MIIKKSNIGIAKQCDKCINNHKRHYEDPCCKCIKIINSSNYMFLYFKEAK